jgi:hypothetical protein
MAMHTVAVYRAAPRGRVNLDDQRRMGTKAIYAVPLAE